MSDEQETIATITVPARAVIRDGVDKMYYVYQYIVGWGWYKIKDARGYKHSTSAYAQLGRITNRENQKAILEIK